MVSTTVALAVLAAFGFFISGTFSSPARYDQRQEGELNIRTDIEDVVFVVVPPKDLVSTGMSLVAATAANLLKKSNGGFGLDRLTQRTASKLGLSPPQKASVKNDLGKRKGVYHPGDPNRYNFRDGKPPYVQEFSAVEVQDAASSTTTTTTTTESLPEVVSTTENKTLEKDHNTNGDGEESPKEKVTEVKEEQKTAAEEAPRVAGEFSFGGLGPTSIFSHEGCGPDAYRDISGICIYKKEP